MYDENVASADGHVNIIFQGKNNISESGDKARLAALVYPLVLTALKRLKTRIISRKGVK